MIKRFSRTLPVYFIITVIYIFVAHGGLQFFTSYENIYSFIKAMMFLPIGYIESRPIYGYAPLIVGWTLNYEIYFYILFSMALLFNRLRWAALLFSAIFTLILIPYFSRGEFSINVYGIYNYSIMYVNMITNPIIFFIMGVGVGIVYNSPFRIKNVFLCWVLIAFVACLTIWQYVTQYQANHGITLWGISLIPLFLSFAYAVKQLT